MSTVEQIHDNDNNNEIIIDDINNETNIYNNNETNNIEDEIILDKNVESEITTFEELDLNDELLRGIYSYGFERPSPIQRLAIRPLIDRRDILAQAQSGTGKTATFAIGSLSIVKQEDNFTQILVLSPTKELSIQSSNVYK